MRTHLYEQSPAVRNALHGETSNESGLDPVNLHEKPDIPHPYWHTTAFLQEVMALTVKDAQVRVGSLSSGATQH